MNGTLKGTYSCEFSKVARTAMIESVVVSRFAEVGRILGGLEGGSFSSLWQKNY